MKRQHSSHSTDPWQRLLAAQTKSEQPPIPDAAPPDFVARVVMRWLKHSRKPTRAASNVDLWELLGLRAALTAGAVAAVAVILSFSTLRDFGVRLDAAVLDPSTLIFGSSF